MGNLSAARRDLTPILPPTATLAYLLAGVECLTLLYVRTTMPMEFRQPNWSRHLAFWEDGYVASWSIPELLVYVNFLCIVVLWLKWRGWRVAHVRRPRSAALAFLVPAMVLALVSWDLVRSMDFSKGNYKVIKMELAAYSEASPPPIPRPGRPTARQAVPIEPVGE